MDVCLCVKVGSKAAEMLQVFDATKTRRRVNEHRYAHFILHQSLLSSLQVRNRRPEGGRLTWNAEIPPRFHHSISKGTQRALSANGTFIHYI